MSEFCPACGQTLRDLVNTGNLGCGNCLFHFPGPALQLVMRNQDGAYQYVGSWPLQGPRLLEERTQVYRAALHRAHEEGRASDVEVLTKLLNSLGAM